MASNAGRIFWDEQNWWRRQTLFCIVLGIIWMALMGYIVVKLHINFLTGLIVMISEESRTYSSYLQELTLSLQGAGISVLFWLIVAIIMYGYSSWIIPRLVGAHLVDSSDRKRLKNIIDEIEIASGVVGANIRWYILESSALNALACGRSPENGSVVITRGLLNILDHDEVQAVAAHEIAHLKNRDTLFVIQAIAFIWMLIGITVAIVSGVALIIVLLMGIFWVVSKLIDAFDQVEFEEESTTDFYDGLSNFLGTLVILGIFAFIVLGAIFIFIMSGIVIALYLMFVGLALFTVALGVKAAASTISQSREYLADAFAVQWTRNPQALASALEKVSRSDHLPRSALISPLLLHNKVADSDESPIRILFLFLLKSHPDINRRISLLRSLSPQSLDYRLPAHSKFNDLILLIITTIVAITFIIALILDAMKI